MNQVAPNKRSASSSATSQKEKTPNSDGEDEVAKALTSMQKQFQDDLSHRPRLPPWKKQKSKTKSATSQSSQSEQSVQLDRFTLYRPDGKRKTREDLFEGSPDYLELNAQILRAAGRIKPDFSAISQEGYPSEGSMYHATGWCWPCNLLHNNNCKSGQRCQKCHFCPWYEHVNRRYIMQRMLLESGEEREIFEGYAALVMEGFDALI